MIWKKNKKDNAILSMTGSQAFERADYSLAENTATRIFLSLLKIYDRKNMSRVMCLHGYGELSACLISKSSTFSKRCQSASGIKE